MSEEKSDRIESMRKGIYILPNLFTTGSLFAGFYSMVATTNGDFRTRSFAACSDALRPSWRDGMS